VRLTQVYAGRKVDYIDPVELAAFAMTGWVGGGGPNSSASCARAWSLIISRVLFSSRYAFVAIAIAPVPVLLVFQFQFLSRSAASASSFRATAHATSIRMSSRSRAQCGTRAGHFEFVCNCQSAETSAWNLAALKQHYDYEMVFPAGGAPGIARVAL